MTALDTDTTKDVLREMAANAAMAVPPVREWRINRPRTGTEFNGDPEVLERYAFQAVRGLERHVGPVTGRSIVEFGPGDTLAAGLAMLARGASLYAALDRFVPDYSNAGAKRWYAGVRDAWEVAFGEPWPDGLDADGFPETSSKVQYIQGSVERAATSDTFDIVTSWQVGEHVRDFGAFARLTAALLAPDGVAVHRVDFGAHDCWRRYDDPLMFLRFSPRVWSAMGSHRGFPNRVRHHECMEAWDAAGLAVECREVTHFDEASIDFSKLHRSFAGAPRDSLMVQDVVYVCRRTSS